MKSLDSTRYLKTSRSDCEALMTPSLTAAYIGYVGAKKNNNGEFLFINYHDMLDDMDSVLDKVYEFIGGTSSDVFRECVVSRMV